MEDKVVDLGSGAYCYLQDSNRGSGWGWSNSGLIVDRGEAIMVDTLRDEPLTAKMLDAYMQATGLKPQDIGTLINTHSDADHTYGNRLMRHARIMASREAVQAMVDRPPTVMQNYLDNLPKGAFGEWLVEMWGPPFQFRGTQPTLPNEYIKDGQELRVGDKTVKIIEVGHAHTVGDIMVHVPQDKILFTGDIIFLNNTPVLWSGPAGNWIRALDNILEMDIETYVPGHGPVTDKNGVRKTREYLVYVEQETRKRFDAGLSLEDAIQDIALGEFEDWGGSERIVVNVERIYAHLSGVEPMKDVFALLKMMLPYVERARRRKGGAKLESGICPTCGEKH